MSPSQNNIISKNWGRLGKKTKKGIGFFGLLAALYASHEPVVWLAKGSYKIYQTIDSAYAAIGDIPLIKQSYARDTARIKEALGKIDRRIDSIREKAIPAELVEIYCKSITDVVKGELDQYNHQGVMLLQDNYGNLWYYRDGWLFKAIYHSQTGRYYFVDFIDGNKSKWCE